MQKPVEMVSYETNFISGPERQIQHYYGFNVPRESITFVKAATLQRKNQAKIGDTEMNTFINGINLFNVAPAGIYNYSNYRQLVSVHQHWWHFMHSMNGELGTQRFLPWHRLYLQVLEQVIRSIPNYSNFFIPYWDWTRDQSIPNWLVNFRPHVDVPDVETIPPTPNSYNHIDVYRTPGQQGGFLPTNDQVNHCLGIPTYRAFTLELEGLHNNVHAWVGGTMTDIMTSPADPLFWLHHANVDRIYTLWQKNHPDSPDTIPNLSGDALVLDPWTGTEPGVRHYTWAEYI